MSHKPLRPSCCMLRCALWNKRGAIKQFQQRSRFYSAHCQHCNQPHPTACFASWTKTASMCSNELQVATPRTGTALEGLRRRFPKVSARSSRNAATGRHERSNTFRPYPNVRRTVGRPLTSETVSKGIVISLEFGREKIPTKSEKAKLERSGQRYVWCLQARKRKFAMGNVAFIL